MTTETSSQGTIETTSVDDIFTLLTEQNGDLRLMKDVIFTEQKKLQPPDKKALLSRMNEDGMTILHLFCEEGWSEECKFIIGEGMQCGIEFGGLLERDPFDFVTPIELLARDYESLVQLFGHVGEYVPHFLSSARFCSALVLEVFVNVDFDEIPADLDLLETAENMIRKNPETLEIDGEGKSLLHRYCLTVIGPPDYNVLKVLVEQGSKSEKLRHGGLSLEEGSYLKDVETPIGLILQPLLKGQGTGSSSFNDNFHKIIDLCVHYAGIAVVAADFIKFFPIKMTLLMPMHQSRANTLLKKYEHLLQKITNEDDLYLFYEAYESICHLPFGKRDVYPYYSELYQLCFGRYLAITADRITIKGNNLFFHAVTRRLPWKGLQFIAKDSNRVILERRNQDHLPASLFAAINGNNVDTIYQLLRRDIGLFDQCVQH